MRSHWQMIDLSIRDYIFDAKLSLCSILGLSAVLAPILVLYGLKFGVITSMIENLNKDPLIREIKVLGQGEYTDQFIDDIRALPGVSFVVPNTRFLSATLNLKTLNSNNKASIRAEMVPSGLGDPLLQNLFLTAPSGNKVYISAALSEELQVRTGEKVIGKIGRVVDKNPQAVRMKLEVAGVLPLSSTHRKLLLVPLDLLTASEDYREGYGVPERDWPGLARESNDRIFASFRVFAKGLDDVAILRQALQKTGVETKTQLDRIEIVKTFDRNLTALFLIITTLAVIGYALAMVVSVIASVSRKQKDISILKLLGFSDMEVSMLPIIQSTLTATAGSLLATGLYFAVAGIINRNFSDGLRTGEVLCRLLPQHLVIAIVASVVLGILTSVFGGMKAATVMPAKGIRNE